jgi:dihydrofolate reductase
MNIIMAVDEQFGYSKDGGIPWENKDDLRHFQLLTKKNIIIMGRKTWESLPIRPLPDRLNIVISNSLKDDERCLIFNDLTSAINMCKNFPKKQIFMPSVWGYPPMPPAKDIYPNEAIVFPI